MAKRMQHVELVWSSCCTILHDVERSLISIKHLMQHRSTFLLFSCVKNKGVLVWSGTLTLLHSCTRSKSSLSWESGIIIHPRFLISTIRVCTAQHVAFVWSRSPTPSNIIEFSNVEWYYICLARAWDMPDSQVYEIITKDISTTNI